MWKRILADVRLEIFIGIIFYMCARENVQYHRYIRQVCHICITKFSFNWMSTGERRRSSSVFFFNKTWCVERQCIHQFWGYSFRISESDIRNGWPEVITDQRYQLAAAMHLKARGQYHSPFFRLKVSWMAAEGQSRGPRSTASRLLFARKSSVILFQLSWTPNNVFFSSEISQTVESNIRTTVYRERNLSFLRSKETVLLRRTE
jgi:hypothetical protein